MLRVTDHVHVKYAMLVQTFDDVLRGNTCRELDNLTRSSKVPSLHTDSRNEQPRSRINDDLN